MSPLEQGAESTNPPEQASLPTVPTAQPPREPPDPAGQPEEDHHPRRITPLIPHPRRDCARGNRYGDCDDWFHPVDCAIDTNRAGRLRNLMFDTRKSRSTA